MADITYSIKLHSEWHCSSGLSAGSGDDLLAIKDEKGLPIIPGKTLKGLIRDAADTLHELEHLSKQFVNSVFGVEAETRGLCHFSSAELSRRAQKQILENNETAFLYRSRASTAIDEKGLAIEHSLRSMELTVPLSLYAQISNVPEENIEDLAMCIRLVKHIGVSRNRGMGRCSMDLLERSLI